MNQLYQFERQGVKEYKEILLYTLQFKLVRFILPYTLQFKLVKLILSSNYLPQLLKKKILPIMLETLHFTWL